MTMQQRPNEITLQKRGEVTLMDIKGDITAFSEPFLNDAYKSSKSQGARNIVINFEDKAYINSGGIAVLIQILVQTKRNNQIVGITGLSEHFKKVFQMVGITKFAAIHSSIDEALNTMSR
jgi:anti-anti-sigma factor